MEPLQALRLAARIIGTMVLLFLLWMTIGHLVGDANGPNGMIFNDRREFVAFLFFPVLSIIGLVLAYKWERLGGALVLVSLAGLFTLMPALMRSPFWLWMLPGVLYLLCAAVARRSENHG